MDMPPSGWYPDPYGETSLLRWWDGAAWTDHTQPFDTTGPVTSRDLPPVTSRDLPPVTSRDLPAIPAADPAATALDLTGAAPSPAEQTAFDLPPVTGPAYNAPGESTRMFSRDDYSGYEQVQRQQRVRRRWIMGALAAGTVAVLALIAVALVKFGNQPAKQTVALKTPAATHTTPPASHSPSPSASSAGTVTDSSSGLSYSQLSTPWQGGCPSTLSGQTFTWSSGESAVAGQVTINGQQGKWYGNACSGPLTQQYGYNGTQDLANTAQNLANAFENSYYNGLQHTATSLVSTPMQVSDHAAWEIKFLITYTDATGEGLKWTSEEGAVVVVDRGTGNEPAVFYASLPSNLGQSHVDSLVSSLQMSATSTATTSPSASASPSPTASATSDGNGGGGGAGNGGGGNGGGGGGIFP